ncbi:MAG: hypothetical protein N2322_03295, partial [Terrimicrobiaceae bacterium]|nr:hypothetical protein [Terrimicrobiaceae bacterium]
MSVKRACKKLREEGAAGFFRVAQPQQGHKLTHERLGQVQQRLDAGMSVPDIGRELGVLPNTIHKAIRAGRLKKSDDALSAFRQSTGSQEAREAIAASSQGERSVADGEAGMG